jgi:hypothetical protein
MKTYVFREAWPYHFDPRFDWDLRAADLFEREDSPRPAAQQQPHPREGQARRRRAIYLSLGAAGERSDFRPREFGGDQWRVELEACGAASYRSGSWTVPVPEFFRETPFTHFTKLKSDFTLVKYPSLLERGEEYKEERSAYSRARARDNGLVGSKKLWAKAHP